MYVLIVGFLHRHTDGSYAPPPFTHTRFDDFQVYENNYVLSVWTEYCILRNVRSSILKYQITIIS